MNYNLHMDIEKEIDKLLTIIFTHISKLYVDRSNTPFFLKGSCSLNRGLSIIDRVSHDIDLTYSLDLLGLKQISPADFTSRTKTERAVKEFDNRCIEFNNEMILQLNKWDYRSEIDPSNPLIIKITLPETDRELLLETGARSLDQKPQKVVVGNIHPFIIYITPPEQSLMERIFGIHSDIKMGRTKLNHIKFMYDIIMINRSNPKLIYNRVLLNRVADFNYIYYRWNREVCESIKRDPIQLIPSVDTLDLYRTSWLTMSGEFMTKKLPFSFEVLLNELNNITERINNQ